MKRAIILALAICCGASSTKAVIVGPGDGTGNTTGSGMSSGWDYVGTVDGASGVYLGNGWVLTAAHVGGISAGSTPFTLSGTTYIADSGATRLTNADSSLADLQMFHVATSPALMAMPVLPLISSTPSNGTTIYMVGYGRNPRNSSATYYSNTTTWAVATDPLTALTAAAGGLGYGTNNIKRWGTNTIDGTKIAALDGFGSTSVLTANFYGGTPFTAKDNYITNTPGSTDEALVSSGDSGGGVFDSSGVLVGINNYLSAYTGQPANTAIFGNASNMADISVYRKEIVALVPEPSSVVVLGGVVVSFFLGRRRRTS